jgi:hypothetical protein
MSRGKLFGAAVLAAVLIELAGYYILRRGAREEAEISSGRTSANSSQPFLPHRHGARILSGTTREYGGRLRGEYYQRRHQLDWQGREVNVFEQQIDLCDGIE